MIIRSRLPRRVNPDGYTHLIENDQFLVVVFGRLRRMNKFLRMLAGVVSFACLGFS